MCYSCRLTVPVTGTAVTTIEEAVFHENSMPSTDVPFFLDLMDDWIDQHFLSYLSDDEGLSDENALSTAQI